MRKSLALFLALAMLAGILTGCSGKSGGGVQARAFGSDETSSSKIVVEGIKKYNKMEIKGAYVEGAYMDEKGINALATIPSKEELYAKCAGALQSIIAGLAVSLKAVADKLENA